MALRNWLLWDWCFDMKYALAGLLLVALITTGGIVFAAAVANSMAMKVVGGSVAFALIGVVWALAGMLERIES